jgi:Integrase core domain
LTLVDHFSKWAEAIPIANHTAQTVAKALMTNVFARYGVPLQLLSDRGPEFESEMFSELMKSMGIDKLRSSAYKPTTNGVVERFHRTLNSMLGKVVSESQRDWDQKLPYVIAAYRSSVHSSTGFSPNKLFLGREVHMPVDLVLGIPEEEKGVQRTHSQYVQNLLEGIESSYEIARKHLKLSAEVRKKGYDVKVRNKVFEVGQWVWYYYPRRFPRKSPKWQKMYTGPYMIVKLMEPVNYVIQKSARSKPIVVHADKLKLCYSSTPESWLQTSHEQQSEQTKNNDQSRELVTKKRKNTRRDDNKVVEEPVPSSNDSDQDNDNIVRNRRENRRKPTRFDDYQM